MKSRGLRGPEGRSRRAPPARRNEGAAPGVGGWRWVETRGAPFVRAVL